MNTINGRAQIMEQQKKIANLLDTLPPIPEERKRRIQQIIGTLLYYALDVDCTMLTALNTLAEQ